jgi:PAS domain S-box-containing protein
LAYYRHLATEWEEMSNKAVRVLLIEDNPADTRLIREILAEAKGTPFELECADRLATGLACLARGGIDVVLLDLGLPDSQGLSTLVKVQAKALTVPIVVLTCLDDETLAVEAVQEGAQDYLVKGQVDSNPLRHSIRYAIERKRAEEALLESEERFRSIVENSHDGIMILDDAYRFIYGNDELCRISGYPRQELIGQDFRQFLDEESRQLVADRYIQRQRGEEVPPRYEFNIVRKDGEKRRVEINSSVIKDSAGKVKTVAQILDITERKHLERRVVEYEELNKLKSNLLSTVSHELRTPLTTIKGYSTMLLDYDRRLKHDEKQEYLNAIDKATDRMAELVDHLLDMSRLEAGLLKLDKVPTNITALLQTIIAEARLRAPGHKIVLNIPKAVLRLNVDGRRIRQVVDNLIDNATKYSKAGTTIKVEARGQNAELVISVADQGTGIHRDNLKRIFDRMFNLEHRLSQDPGGLGLGLALCKALVEAHGGRIWVESELGKGSVFNFALSQEAIAEGEAYGQKRQQSHNSHHRG